MHLSVFFSSYFYFSILWEHAEISPISNIRWSIWPKHLRSDSSNMSFHRSLEPLSATNCNRLPTAKDYRATPNMDFVNVLPSAIYQISPHTFGRPHPKTTKEYACSWSIFPGLSPKFGAKADWRNCPPSGSLQLSYCGHHFSLSEPSQSEPTGFCLDRSPRPLALP